MIPTIKCKDISDLPDKVRALGYEPRDVFLKLARCDRSTEFVGSSSFTVKTSSGTMFIASDIRGVISKGDLETGQLEHLERIHCIIPVGSVKPIAAITLPEDSRAYFPGDRSAKGTLGYLMEYVDGIPLSYHHERLSINRKSPSWSWHANTFMSVARQAIALVNKLNDSGLAHGDLGPHNVMIVDGKAVLIDAAVVPLHSDPEKDMALALQIDVARKMQLEMEIGRLLRDN